MNNMDDLIELKEFKLNEEQKIKFKDRLIKLRKMNGWSQEELGYKLNVSRQTISKWESSDTMPEMDKIIHLSKIYNLSIDELVYGSIKTEEVKNDLTLTNDDINNTENNDFPKTIYDEEKKNIIKKYIIRAIIFVISIVFIGYLIKVIYNFCILKSINDKFNEYKDVNNCYFQSNEVVSNDKGTLYMITTKIWYKDGILKKEETKTENGETNVYYTLIDLNKEEKMFLCENTKEGSVMKYEEKDKFKEGIINYLIGSYYKERNVLLDSLFNSIIETENNIIINNNYSTFSKEIFNKENSLIEQNYSKNLKNEENRITYEVLINCIKDEELNIHLDEYNLKNK